MLETISLNCNIAKENFRNEIMGFQENLMKVDGAFIGDSDICPLKHSFSDGVYVREIFIPKGTVLVGKIHKHDHPNFLMSGEVEVVTESGGSERLKAPLSMISKAGTKRVVKALKDTVWITIHSNPTNTQNLTKLEEIVIANSYGDYEKFIENKDKNFLLKGINKIIKYIKR